VYQLVDFLMTKTQLINIEAGTSEKGDLALCIFE